MLLLRRMIIYLYGECFMGKAFPTFELIRLYGEKDELTEKHLRFQQYQYYQKHRDDKYDFMEIGVLEKFPYPLDERQEGM
jgi:hypothetical protein